MSATERTQTGSEPPEAELTTLVRQLSDRVEALQSDVRRLGGPGLPDAAVGWDDGDEGVGEVSPSYAWVTSLGAPVRRRPAVPRLLLEALFLAAVAAGAALAELESAVIVAVMAGAWLLVALIEWAASRADRRRDEIMVMQSPEPALPMPADPSWFVAPVEQTLLEPPADSPTAVTKLPPPTDVDTTVDRPADA